MSLVGGIVVPFFPTLVLHACAGSVTRFGLVPILTMAAYCICMSFFASTLSGAPALVWQSDIMDCGDGS